MVRHSVFTSMIKLVIALLTALVFVGIGGVTVSAGAHHCGCQTDNSGPGSNGPDNSGPGNACHDNSGPGSTDSGNSGPSTTDNSGPGSGDECPTDAPPEEPGDSTDPGNGPSMNNGGGSGEQTAEGTVVLGAQASSAPTEADAAVPTAVNAGLTGGASEESPSALAGLAILLGLAMTFAAVRRRTRA